MRIIENINSLLRFIGYLMPLMFLLFGRDLIWRVFNKLRWYHQDLLKAIYIGMIIVAALFAIVAIYKLIRFGNYRRYKQCKENITVEVKIKIAQLAERDPDIEQFFIENTEWLEADLEHLIDSYAKTISKLDFEEFRQYVNNEAILYYSHRVSNRKQFLSILNKL